MANEQYLNKVIHGDCLEWMPYIEDESVDLIVTDPPYMMNYRSNRRVKSDKFDFIRNDVDSFGLIESYLAECHRILKNDTAIYMFCSWHHIDFFKTTFEKHFKLKNLIVWNKNNHGSGDLRGAYAPKHELILFGHKGRSVFQDKRRPDVLDSAKVPSANLTHPTEKPVELLDIFIKNNSAPGDTVFDGFAGTGSTCVSAVNNGRNFIAIEQEWEFCEVADSRIDEAIKARHFD